MTSSPGACPRTGRTRALAVAPGELRPSDLLTAFLVVGVVWIALAAAMVGIGRIWDVPEWRWLALHFAFLGGVSQLVLGAAQFFATAFLATEPPSRRSVRSQLLLWNAATVAVAAGVTFELSVLTAVGGTLVLVALGVFAASLRALAARSIQRVPWATRWYLAAAGMLAAGAVLGAVMGSSLAWAHGSLLGAHLALNLGGWLGTVIVGTLHTFFPSLTATRLPHPELQRPAFAAWTSGVMSVAVAAAFDLAPLAVLGWSLLLVATGCLAVNVVGCLREAPAPPTPPAALITAGQAMLAAAVLVGLGGTLASGPYGPLLGDQRPVLTALLGGGWIGLTVAGSLLHLLPLMARVRGGFRATGAAPRLPLLVAGGAVALGLVARAAATGLGVDALAGPAALVLAAGAAVLLVVIGRAATSAARPGGSSPGTSRWRAAP